MPINEKLENRHWYQWFNNGFWSDKPLLPMVFDPATIDADGFKVWQPLDTMVFQWFPMVANHRSNDGMVRIHGYGLQRKLETKVSGLTEKQKKDSARQI